uniref:Uncharacterized protein n=2 Tax=Candidatus Kentrum sp. TC TaxID=2126339 RepID=A0A450ZUB6_9GAMM|nr:MAG: hypothetical protein BECKTC1821F_GA0114240_10172 [Candidatus Kentron sp. TC]
MLSYGKLPTRSGEEPEFKYVPLKELGLSGEEVKAKTRQELRALPRVAAALDEAEAQLSRYRAALEEVYGDKLRLRTHPVVALGFSRLVW